MKIFRDEFGVAHVNGKTEADVAYGAGWVTAADRGLLLQLIRGPARVAALDVPGLDPLALALSGKTLRAERRRRRRSSRTRSTRCAVQRSVGPKILALVNAYAAGINGYYRSKGIPATPFTANDVIASAALIAARFGTNGGQEAQNSMFLDALEERFGEADARRVFADLRESNDPESRRERAGLLPAADARRRPRPAAWCSTTAASRARRSPRLRSPRTRCSSARSSPRPGTRCSSPARRSATSSRSSSQRWSSPAPASTCAAPCSRGCRSCSSAAVRTSPGAPRRRRRTTSTCSSRRCAETTSTTCTAASASRCGGSSSGRSRSRVSPTSRSRTTRRRTALSSGTRRSEASESPSRSSARRAVASCSRRRRSTT